MKYKVGDQVIFLSPPPGTRHQQKLIGQAGTITVAGEDSLPYLVSGWWMTEDQLAPASLPEHVRMFEAEGHSPEAAKQMAIDVARIGAKL